MRMMSVLRWVVIFVYLQFIFIVGTLAGLVVGGFFPSLYATILTAKQLMKTRVDYTATRKYIQIYKAIFWKSQIFGYLNCFIALVCLSNVLFFNQLQATQPWAFAVKMVWFFVSIIVLLIFSLIGPTFVDYQLKLKMLPQLFLIALGDFRSMIILAGSTIMLYFLFLFFTGIFLFLILGIYLLIIARVSQDFEKRKVIFDKQEGELRGGFK